MKLCKCISILILVVQFFAVMLSVSAYVYAGELKLITSEVFLQPWRSPSVISYTWSLDGKNVAYILNKDGKQCVVEGRQEGGLYDSIVKDSVTFSPDSKRLAYVALRGEKQIVVADGAEGKEYDRRPNSFLRFSGDSKHVIYWANQGKNVVYVCDGKELLNSKGLSVAIKYSKDKMEAAFHVIQSNSGHVISLKEDGKLKDYYPVKTEFVVWNDSIGKKYLSIMPETITFNKDYSKIAYLAKQWRKKKSSSDTTPPHHVVVMNSKEQATCYYINPESFQFSPDGGHLVCIATREDNKLQVILDGKQGKAYKNLHHLVFSPDGKHLAYIAYEETLEGKTMIVMDGIESKDYFPIYYDTLAFSADSKHSIYVAGRDGKLFGVADGQESSNQCDICKYTKCVPVAVDPEKQRVAFLATRGDKSFVIVDGVEGTEYSNISNVRFSGDGKHISYLASRDRKRIFVMDGKESQEYDRIRIFSADPAGNRIAYLGNESVVLVDGIEGKAYRTIDKADPFFSPNGEHFAYIGSNRSERYLVLNNNEVNTEYKVLSLKSFTFSPDSKHFAYISKGPKGKPTVVVDNARTEEYDWIDDRLVFDSPNELHARVLKGKEQFRLDIKLVE